MADLSFIEDAVAFPEKEEDEDEEEEGVEWGYEEGNRRACGVRGPGAARRGGTARAPFPRGPLRTPLSHVGPRAFPRLWPALGPQAFAGASPAFLQRRGWHLPPSAARALKLQLITVLSPEEPRAALHLTHLLGNSVGKRIGSCWL